MPIHKNSIADFFPAFAMLGVALLAGCQVPQNGNLSIPNWSDGNSTFRYQEPGDFLDKVDVEEGLKPAVGQTSGQANRVSKIEIKGNKTIPELDILRQIRTRRGKFFDPDLLQQDVESLTEMKRILRVNRPLVNKTPEGVEVTLEIIERPFVNRVRYLGNRAIHDFTLRRQTGLDENQPLNVHEVKMARQKLENFYREKGYPRTEVELIHGDENNHNDVIFLIHEDKKHRIFRTAFVGNQIASDARLRHFIKSKPGILWVFGGDVNRNQIQQDQTRLTAYYRSLGFFNARVGRELIENDNGWVTIRFIIDEGPRYKVRSITFAGNQQYRGEDLATLVKLQPTHGNMPEFNAAKMAKDVNALRDLYGSQGYVFADVQAEPRFLEEPGMLDIVYKISEGKQYRVGKINVHIDGDSGLTKHQVVLDRVGLTPGDLIDSRKLRNSERRLISTQIFAGGQGNPGPPPRIVVRPPELRELERLTRENGAGQIK